MITEAIEARVKEFFCGSCRAKTSDPDCPFADRGCLELSDAYRIARMSAVEVLEMVQDKPIYLLAGFLRDSINQLRPDPICYKCQVVWNKSWLNGSCPHCGGRTITIK